MSKDVLCSIFLYFWISKSLIHLSDSISGAGEVCWRIAVLVCGPTKRIFAGCSVSSTWGLVQSGNKGLIDLTPALRVKYFDSLFHYVGSTPSYTIITNNATCSNTAEITRGCTASEEYKTRCSTLTSNC